MTARRLGLLEAAAEIAHSVTLSRQWKPESPYFFMVGAGISMGEPGIPGSAEIITRCQAVRPGGPELAQSASALDRYSAWLEYAYPSPQLRQHFFNDLIKDVKPTAANMRLANLLHHGGLTRVALTPNFDELLTKALRLFGAVPVICDHPATGARLRSDPGQIKVVHIHGTHLDYDIKNRKAEVEATAQRSPTSAATMADLVGWLLTERSPIVVGYAGWGSDVFMTALRRHAECQRLATTLYWFCHTAADADALPGWLRDHDEVVIVGPESRQLAPDPGSPIAAEEPKLDAERVFGELGRALNVGAPRIVQDPLETLCDQLEGFRRDAEQDIFSIASVIERVRRVAAG